MKQKSDNTIIIQKKKKKKGWKTVSEFILKLFVNSETRGI